MDDHEVVDLNSAACVVIRIVANNTILDENVVVQALVDGLNGSSNTMHARAVHRQRVAYVVVDKEWKTPDEEEVHD